MTSHKTEKKQKAVIFLPVWQRIMIALFSGETHLSKLRKKADLLSYIRPHTIDVLREQGWITARMKGRNRIISLTKEGSRIAYLLTMLHHDVPHFRQRKSALHTTSKSLRI